MGLAEFEKTGIKRGARKVNKTDRKKGKHKRKKKVRNEDDD